MSRFRRVVHNITSSYAVLVATAIYALASVPLALHYLSKEAFALWALMSSIGGYLNLIDFGMSSSVARILIDHKDERESGVYGNVVKTGWMILAVQGLLLFTVAFVLAPILSELLKIEPDLRNDFIRLMRWQSAALALSMATQISRHLLFAHQRLDILSYVQMVTLGVNFALQWLFFHLQTGVLSLAWSSLASTLFAVALFFALCGWLGFFPPRGRWGHASRSAFKEIFAFGKDLFLVAVGGQLIMASQTMIITRVLGLQAAALWAVGTKTFNLILQVVCRVADVSCPPLAEMMVRGERALLRQRYQSVVMLTGSLSAFAAIGLALCNSSFVTVWTHRQFAWPSGNDLLLGAWLILLSILHAHNCFVLMSKQVRFMRYIYFIEGLVFVAAAFVSSRWGGLPAVIVCSVICSICFSGAYGVWRIARYFDCPVSEIVFNWLVPMFRLTAVLGPLALLLRWALRFTGDPLPQFLIACFFCGTLGFYLFLRLGLPQSVQRELMERAPRGFNPLLRWVFVGAGHSG